jgi:hypothetical protein
MKFLKYISLLAVGGLIYIFYNALAYASYVKQFRQEKITLSVKLNIPAPEPYPVIYDVLITLIPTLKY